MKGRAITPAQKEEVLQRILTAWKEVPHQRLSQFIHNAITRQGRDLFNVEDEQLAEELEAYVFGRKPPEGQPAP